MKVKFYKVSVLLSLSLLLATGQAFLFPSPVAQAQVLGSDQLFTHERLVLFQEIPLVQLLSEEDGYARTACAGTGLNNVQPSPKGPIVLIPNAGDLSIAGSNVSIKLDPSGQVTFIPRTEGQLIRVPVNVNDKPYVAPTTNDRGETNEDDVTPTKEVASFTLNEALQYMDHGHLVWTANNQGPYGNGFGLPGHIAACDPQFNESVYKDFRDSLQKDATPEP